MSNYTKTTDFEAKDSLPTGDSGKIIRGAEFETEFDAISTAIATKADTAGPTFTGTLTFETISDGTIGVTAFVDEDDMSSDSATLVPTQQSVKAYVDSQVTAQDLDFQADTGGALSIDLDSETMTFTGGTGIDTSGLGNAVTFAIDSTVATLTGTQTLTNKTLTSPDVNTPDIDGGTIDGTVIGGTTPAAVSATTVSATGNITVGGTVDGRDVATDGTKLDGIESGATADQTAAEIRTLVDSATDSNVFTDADHTKLDGIEANATADQTDAEIRAAVEAATDSNVFTDADHSKLDGIEASADVTDTTNVTAAGAVMDSELTNETAVKSLDQGVATTDSPTFDGLTIDSSDVTLATIQRDGGGGGGSFGGYNIKFNAVNSSLGDNYFLGVNVGGGFNLSRDSSNLQPIFTATSTGIDVNGTVEFNGLSGTGSVTVTDILDQDDMSSNSATALATQQSIKAYVDSQVATADTLAEVLGNGNTTGGTDIAVGTGDDITFADSSKAIFGADSDLQIYHDSNNSFVKDAGTGDLYVAADNLRLTNSSATEFYARGISNGAFSVYYDGAEKLATTSTGIDVTGTVDASLDLLVGGAVAGNAGTRTINVGTAGSVAGGVQIWAGTTQTSFLQFGDDSSISANHYRGYLSYNHSTDTLALGAAGSTKVSVTSTGIDVTGTAVTDGLTVAGTAQFDNYGGTTGKGRIQFGNSGQQFIEGLDTGNGGSGAYLRFGYGSTETARFDNSGNFGIGTSSPDAPFTIQRPSNNQGIAAGLSLKGQDGTTQGGLGTDGVNDNAVQLVAAQFIKFHTSNTDGTANERMRIDSSGNVGIGNTSPSSKFTNYKNTSISGSAGATLSLEDDSQPRMMMVADSSTSYISSFDSNPITFSVTAGNFSSSTGTERMRIDSSGNVGIGVTNVGAPLDIGTSNPKLRLTDSDGGYSEVRGNGGVITLTADAGNAVANSAIVFETDNTERMRIDSSGNVQQATSVNGDLYHHIYNANTGTSTEATLYISNGPAVSSGLFAGTTGTAFTTVGGFVQDGAHIGAGSASAGGLSIMTRANAPIRFYTNGHTNERMRLDESGNLLVGTTSLADVDNKSTAHLLEGASSLGGRGAVGVYNNSGTANCPALVVLNLDASTDTSNRFIQFYADVSSSGSTAMGGIVGNGASNVQFAALSDAREKTNIQSISGSLTKINSLNPVEFDWIASGEHVNAGFVAQEVEQVFPEFVVANMAEEGAEERKGLTGGMTGGIVAHLVKAIQEQNELINDLRARVAQLEGEN